MQDGKRGWDTRAWLLGLVGGAACGTIRLACDNARFAAMLNRHTASHLSGLPATQILLTLSASAGLIILPACVSGLARRFPFLWGLLPIVATILPSAWVDQSRMRPGNALWVWFAAGIVFWLLISGPVSLFRHLRVRAGRRREAALAALVAQREAASIPQEGVWPPPPDYRQ